MTSGGIALRAEQAANLLRFVAVIDDKFLPATSRRTAACRAAVLLFFDHLLVLFGCDSVAPDVFSAAKFTQSFRMSLLVPGLVLPGLLFAAWLFAPFSLTVSIVLTVVLYILVVVSPPSPRVASHAVVQMAVLHPRMLVEELQEAMLPALDAAFLLHGGLV